MDLLATTTELATRLGRTIGADEQDRAKAVLEDATALVREEIGYPALVPTAVKAVVLRAAERAMRNPGGYSSESSGDYSFQRNAVAGPGVYLTEGELKILRRATGRRGLWTQQVTRDEAYSTNMFLEDQFGGDLILYDTYRE